MDALTNFRHLWSASVVLAIAPLWPCLRAQSPPNQPAALEADRAGGRIVLSYGGGTILSASLAIASAGGERTPQAAQAPILDAGTKGARGIVIEQDIERGDRESVVQCVRFRLSGARP